MMQKDRALSLLIAMESALEDERFEVHSSFIDALHVNQSHIQVHEQQFKAALLSVLAAALNDPI